jgi:CDP-diacylglycerol--glycerol-3-phosphate 3-phosphatidyltransferase
MQHEPPRSKASSSLLRLIPNAISISRLLATPFLLATVLWHRLYEFKWLLLVCFLSDILDGAIARIFRLRSQLGAFLDSIADLLVLLIAMSGIVVFQGAFLAAHYVPLIFVVALHLAEFSAALLRYGRISSFHTILNRIAAYALGIFIMSLLIWGYRGWLFDATIVLMVLACAEEIVLLFLLPRWQSDVRGLYWILSERSATPP